MRETTALDSKSAAGARVQHVYALDVQELSDRLGVSQQELVDGIARDHDHIALQQMLGHLTASTITKANDELSLQHQQLQNTSRTSDGASGDDESDVKVCRAACLLLLPPQDASTGDGGARDCSFVPLTRLEDGRTVLEHILYELLEPKLIDHLVVCFLASKRESSRLRQTKMKKLSSRLCAAASVRVDYVEVEGGDEVRAIQAASQRFVENDHVATEGRRQRSDGFLILRGDRIFDAPTIRMMALATGSNGSRCNREIRIRALVDLDVELTNGGDDKDEDASAPYAGIFAFIGEAAVITDQLERTHSLDEQQQRFPATLTELMVDAAAVTKDDKKLAVSIEKVVASDYCSWREVSRQSNNKGQSVARHIMNSLHSKDQKDRKTRQRSPHSPSYSEQSQQSFEYFEFPRERSASLSHGYHGFRVETKHAETRESESTKQQQQTIGQSTCERNPLLLSKTVDSDGFDNRSEDSLRPEDEDLELGTSTTVLTEADFDAMFRAKNQAFLFQVGPDEQQQQTHLLSSSSSNNSILTSQRRQSTHSDAPNDVVFLALPDPIAPSDKHHHSVVENLHSHFHPHIRLRRFSQLPSDVQEVKMEAVMLPHQYQSQSLLHAGVTTNSAVSVNVVVKKQVPVVGYVILITALCSISSQGAVQDLLVGVPPLLKVFWRMTGASLAFAPLAIASLWQNNWALPVLSVRKKALFALCGVSYAIYNATFIVALSLTSVGHTYIFSNCHSLLMVLLKLVLRQPLGVLELVGAGVGFSGGVITTLDHHSASASAAASSHLGGHEASTLGDMIAFAGAFAGVAYLMSAKQVRHTMDVFVFMWMLVTTVAVLVLLVLLWDHEALGSSNFLSTDATHGLFGWVHHIGIEAYVVLVGSFAGTMGFVTSLKYFDPLVVSVTMLTEPVVATVIGICIGVDELPGLLTFLGGCAVLTGCALVILASHKTSARVDVSDALVVPVGAAQRLEARSIQKRRRHSTFQQHQQEQEQAQRKVTLRVNYGSFP